jgi:hypothetical protein
MPREWATGVEIGGWILSGAKVRGVVEEYEAPPAARRARFAACVRWSAPGRWEGVDRRVGSATCSGVLLGLSCAAAASGGPNGED